jgi:hypothetical protein
MAELLVDGGELVLHLSATEKVGAVHGGGLNIFAAVLPDTPRGLRIVLDGSFYHEWIVGCADPEATARQIAPASAQVLAPAPAPAPAPPA